MDETPKPPEPFPEVPKEPRHSMIEGAHPASKEDVRPPNFSSSEASPSASRTPCEKQWAVAIHLSALIGFVIPFFNIIVPLILWIFKRPESAWLDAEGKRVLNFQISFTIYAIVAGLSLFILIGFLLLPILAIVYLVFLVLGAIRASEGISYAFPLTIKFLS